MNKEKKMQRYKVLFLDIDGTILKPDHTYDESTKYAIREAQRQGVEVFLATGRPLHEIRPLAQELNVDSFIGYNGALAIYQEKTIVNEPINHQIIEQFIQIASENGHEMVLYTSDSNYFTSLEHPAVENFIEMFQLKNNKTYTEEVANKILGATLINLKTSSPEPYEFDPAFHFSQVNIEGLMDCYDVIRDSVNKGEAINKILAIMDIDSNDAIAFGDGMNDKEMLQTVGESFAMGNAHPKLFSYAKHTTLTVSENGIFHGLQSLGIVK